MEIKYPNKYALYHDNTNFICTQINELYYKIRINKIKNEYMAVQNNHNGLIRARKPPLVMTSFFHSGEVHVLKTNIYNNTQEHRKLKLSLKFK